MFIIEEGGGREADIIAADRHPVYRRIALRSTTSLSPPTANISCVSWKPSHVACAERGDSERKHGVCGGGGDPCGISQTFLHLAKSVHDQGELYRRGIRVNCGLSTCMITFSRSHWSKDRSGHRRPVTVPGATAGGIVLRRLPRVCGLHNSPAKQHGTAHPVTPDDGLHSTGATGPHAIQSLRYAHKCHRHLLISWTRLCRRTFPGRGRGSIRVEHDHLSFIRRLDVLKYMCRRLEKDVSWLIVTSTA